MCFLILKVGFLKGNPKSTGIKKQFDIALISKICTYEGSEISRRTRTMYNNMGLNNTMIFTCPAGRELDIWRVQQIVTWQSAIILKIS
jgi:hypothetical protein